MLLRLAPEAMPPWCCKNDLLSAAQQNIRLMQLMIARSSDSCSSESRHGAESTVTKTSDVQLKLTMKYLPAEEGPIFLHAMLHARDTLFVHSATAPDSLLSA
jgi:hypothetical protein